MAASSCDLYGGTLDRVLEEKFTESEFVKQTVGVGNVCERSALKAAGRKKLLQGKVAEGGVTVAVALQEYKVYFT